MGVLALVCGLHLAACDPTPEKIARWKETEKGPAKLRDAVKRSSLAAGLRGQALTALVELGMTQEGLADLKGAPESERREVVREAVPRLTAVAKGTGAVETTRAQREAKDALFLLRDDAAPDDRAKIDDALIAWTTADLTGRMAQGGQGTEKILAAIGVRAVPRLIELISTDGPNQLQAAAILGRIADPPSRARAAEALVESARRTHAKTRDVPDALLRAVAMIGGPHASAFLVDQAEHGNDAVRQRALLALGQGASLSGDATALAAAMRLAADKKVPAKVRDAAFEVAEKVGPDAVPHLITLMNDPDEIIRWRAVEAALSAGKEKAVGPVLEALSPSRVYKKEDLDSYVVHDLGLVGPAALPPLKAALKSGNLVARTVAVRAIAAIGKTEDAPALAALEADSTKLKGFPGNATLGSEAKAAVAQLRSKK